MKPNFSKLDNNFNAKICDFGMSKTVANTIKNSTKATVGTVQWSGPEYLDRKRIEERNGKGDVFSFGVIVWEIVSGKFPWESQGYSPLDVVSSIIAGERLEIPKTCDSTLKTMMLNCWKHSKP